MKLTTVVSNLVAVAGSSANKYDPTLFRMQIEAYRAEEESIKSKMQLQKLTKYLGSEAMLPEAHRKLEKYEARLDELTEIIEQEGEKLQSLAVKNKGMILQMLSKSILNNSQKQ